MRRRTEAIAPRAQERVAAEHLLLVRCEANGVPEAPELCSELYAAPGLGWRVSLLGARCRECRPCMLWEYIPPDARPILQVHVVALASAEVARRSHAAGDRELGRTFVQVLRFRVTARSGTEIPEGAASCAVADFLSGVRCWFEMPRPVCPRCGADRFHEAQIVAQRQVISWDEQMAAYTYGDSEFGDVEQTEALTCAQCDLALPHDYLAGWA